MAVDLDSTAGRALGETEVRRVVALRGSARVRHGGTWRTLGPARGARLDDWTHHWYDATGNCETECGLAIADGRLCDSCEDGHVVCFAAAATR